MTAIATRPPDLQQARSNTLKTRKKSVHFAREINEPIGDSSSSDEERKICSQISPKKMNSSKSD